MKLLLISDLHLLWDSPIARLDDAPAAQRQKLEFVLEYAKENDMVILQAGDFFDRPRSWMLLPIVIDLLKNYGVKTYCVYGQHDTYMYSSETRDSTSLGILAKFGLVTILGSELTGSVHIGRDPTVSLYGCSFGQEVPEVVSDEFNVLVIHAPIAESALFPGHDYVDARRFLKKHKNYDLTLCGDIHRFFCVEQDERFILNTGPMLRRTAEQYSFEHRPGFFTFDTGRIEERLDWVEIPHEPSEKVLSRDHIENPQLVNEMLDKFVSSISTSTEIEGVDFERNLQAFIEGNAIEQSVVDLISEKMSRGER